MGLRNMRRFDAPGIVCMGFLIVLSIQSCSPDHGLGPTVQGIRGTVRFRGSWPENVLEVRVVASETFPPESFLDISGYSEALPLLSDSVAYEIELAPGTYEFVAAACRKSTDWDTDCLLGFHHVEGYPGIPQTVEVRSGGFTGNVDITVDFDDLPMGSNRFRLTDRKPLGSASGPGGAIRCCGSGEARAEICVPAHSLRTVCRPVVPGRIVASDTEEGRAEL